MVTDPSASMRTRAAKFPGGSSPSPVSARRRARIVKYPPTRSVDLITLMPLRAKGRAAPANVMAEMLEGQRDVAVGIEVGVRSRPLPAHQWRLKARDDSLGDRSDGCLGRLIEALRVGALTVRLHLDRGPSPDHEGDRIPCPTRESMPRRRSSVPLTESVPVPHELGLQTVWRRLLPVTSHTPSAAATGPIGGLAPRSQCCFPIAIVERAPLWRTPARRNSGHRGRPILEGQGGS